MKTFLEFNESLANYNKHKIKVKVSKDGGEKHHIDMTVHATSESEAKGIARMKLHKKGYTTHSASHQGIDTSWLKKEEVEQIDELSSDLLQRYKDKAMKSADELTSKGKHKEANDRLLAHMKATGKQIEKTTADIRKAVGK